MHIPSHTKGSKEYPGKCWVYHTVTKISNGTGFDNGDYYRKLTHFDVSVGTSSASLPNECKPPAPAPPAHPKLTGWRVQDQFLRYAFPVSNYLKKEKGAVNTLTVALESVAFTGPGGIHSEWVGIRKEPSNFG